MGRFSKPWERVCLSASLAPANAPERLRLSCRERANTEVCRNAAPAHTRRSPREGRVGGRSRPPRAFTTPRGYGHHLDSWHHRLRSPLPSGQWTQSESGGRRWLYRLTIISFHRATCLWPWHPMVSASPSGPGIACPPSSSNVACPASHQSIAPTPIRKSHAPLAGGGRGERGLIPCQALPLADDSPSVRGNEATRLLSVLPSKRCNRIF
jgi:hypothetical protein